MGDDATVNEVVDVDFAAAPADEVERIDVIPHQEVEQAAQAVVRAAVEARGREIVEDYAVGGGHAGEDGVYRPYLMDYATGDYYIPMENGWYNSATGENVSRDPREIDAGEYEWIIDYFTYFHERWPSYPQTMAQHCQTAKAEIQSGKMTPILAVGRAVSWWGGDARDNFLENFLDPFVSQTVTNQQALLDELAVAMHAYEAVLKQGRLDAKTIADQTVGVLDSTGHGSGGDVSVLLGVVGIAVAVVGTLLTAGTTTALTLGLIGAGLQTANLAVKISEDQTIAGETVDEVLRTMAEVLDELRQAMDAEEDLIAEAVEKQADQVRDWLSSSSSLAMATILPNEPSEDGVTDITGGELPDRDEFRPRH